MANIQRERLEEIKADVLRLTRQPRKEQGHLIGAIVKKIDRLLGEAGGGEVG